jgi:hypothetical protein
MSLVAIDARISYGEGLYGKKMQFESEGCTLERMTPWIDLLPRRFFNFFAGSESCHQWGYQPFSTLKHGVLTIECPAGRSAKVDVINLPLGNPSYVINPNYTRPSYPTWHEGERVDVNDLSRPWSLISPKHIHRRYDGPVKITEGEFISAHCADKEELRIQG